MVTPPESSCALSEYHTKTAPQAGGLDDIDTAVVVPSASSTRVETNREYAVIISDPISLIREHERPVVDGTGD